MWTDEEDLKTISVGANLFQMKTNTCGLVKDLKFQIIKPILNLKKNASNMYPTVFLQSNIYIT